jgi:hypothetical protein
MAAAFVLRVLRAFVLAIVCATSARAAGGGREVVDLSGSGWSLWQDKAANWKDDELFAPPVDVARLPVNPPTVGWEAIEASSADGAKSVAVPGTAEQYLQHGEGPDGDIVGVTWWSRRVSIPPAANGKRLLLRFEAVRQRAEVFVNRKLVGYDLVGNTPFDVDVTDAVGSSSEAQLAVRITDPGGNFEWRDGGSGLKWGKYKIPTSHGFGGITGRVRLVACDREAYVDDLYVQNTPAITSVNAIVTVRNTTPAPLRRGVIVTVTDRATPPVEIARQELNDVQLQPGDSRVRVTFDALSGKPWDLDHPNLYVCRAALSNQSNETDSDQKLFGFRWIGPDGVGTDAVFRLNGKRIVLRTAISWGFWPITGIFPSPELAEKEIRTAKSFGQNMLNFHRCIGNAISFEKADELGLLIYEEPGNYVSGGGDAFAHQLMHEKLMRMVKRDRSHPSLAIYNMINEGWDSGGTVTVGSPGLAEHEQDMRDAHALDPSRVITHTSAWARGKSDVTDDPAKMHMRPFDDAVQMTGWYDFHRAGGPETWNQRFYKKPGDFYGYIDDKPEIVYYGEEGALSTPPRLALIKPVLDAAPQLGWDGQVYLDWYKAFDDFLTRKNLRGAFPTLDDFTRSMGNLSMYHQGRKIESIRIANTVDGYAVNGWEAEIIENHSGIVDCFRNPKGDPTLLAYYNQPLYVAVKARNEVVETPGDVVADFYLVNERDVKGPHTLRVTAKDAAGQAMFTKDFPVSAIGGETYGQLLVDNVHVPISAPSGLVQIEASLLDSSGMEVTHGREQVLAVQWKNASIHGSGAVWESGHRVSTFLKDQKQVDAAAYADELPRLDWVVVTRPPDEGGVSDITAEQFRNLQTTFLLGREFDQVVHHRTTDKTINFTVDDGSAPDPAVAATENYGVRWEGQIVPPLDGTYTFVAQTSGGARLTIDGRDAFDALAKRSTQTNRAKVDLKAGQPVSFTLEFHQQRGGGRCRLQWAVPEVNAPSPAKLLARVRDDGTTLLVLDRTDTWMDLITKNAPGVTYGGNFIIGRTWLGGEHFVKQHPLFKDLPVNCAMDWPYQSVVRDGNARSGLLLEGEELVAGAYHCYPMKLGTAVGVIPCGKGKIIVSTLDICDNLASREEPANVARKLLCNFLEYAVASR